MSDNNISKRKNTSPVSLDKAARYHSPEVLGLSIDPRLLSSNRGTSQINMENNVDQSATPRSTASATAYITPPGPPRPAFDPTAPTQPAIAMKLPDQQTFQNLDDSSKLNCLYMQNTAILAGQNYTNSLLAQMVRNQQAQIENQAQALSVIQNQLASVNRFSLASAFMELEVDREERAEKKNNLVLVGLAEPKQDDKDDLEVVKMAFKAAGADPEVVTEVFRLGPQREEGEKPRPVKVFTSSYDSKMILLRGQRKAFAAVPEFTSRAEKPYLRHDLSKLQRDQDFELRKQLTQARSLNPTKNLVVRDGKIIERRGN